jgi:hypothetical protein
MVLAKGADNEGVSNAIVVDIIPSARAAHQDIPAIAREYLQQAMDTLASPDASAVMSGSAVDAMLKQLKYSSGSVYERIDQAVADHVLTDAMGKWAHEVRLGSNRPRHADEKTPHVSSDEAKQSLEFAEALGSFLFVLTARIQKGTLAAQKATPTP